MALVDPNTLAVGQVVTFTCYHPTDLTKYEGTIVGISSFGIVNMLEGDLVPYHQEVLKIVPTLNPIEKLKFVTLEYQQENKTHRVSRALDWINVSSLTILETDQKFDIRIYDRPTSETDQVLELLRSHGYLCSLLTT